MTSLPAWTCVRSGWQLPPQCRCRRETLTVMLKTTPGQRLLALPQAAPSIIQDSVLGGTPILPPHSTRHLPRTPRSVLPEGGLYCQTSLNTSPDMCHGQKSRSKILKVPHQVYNSGSWVPKVPRQVYISGSWVPKVQCQVYISGSWVSWVPRPVYPSGSKVPKVPRQVYIPGSWVPKVP